MSTQLQMPAIGWQFATTPCSECFGMVERESRGNIYAGQQQDCYACHNRLTVYRIAQDGPSRTDMLSAFERERDPVAKKWVPIALAFNAGVYRGDAINKWIAHHGLEGFPAQPTKMDIDWAVFIKEVNPEASVLVLLDDGVVGRCLLVEDKETR